MGKQPKVKQLRKTNKSSRVEYGETHEDDTVKSFWQYVIFTDEAHVDPGQMNRQHVLREEGTRYRPDNMQEMPSLQEVKLHMAGSISWHHKGKLTFYHDKKDVPLIQKKPKTRKPRHRKAESDQEYQNRLREWKSKKPHEAEIKQKGNSMTNKYYTEHLLPVYLKEIEKAKKAERRAILQEDDDPSHGIKGSDDNLARSFKQKHGMELLKHPAQSPDLNPHEGVWDILKPRVRKHQWNSLSELKKVILDEWDKITMEEIRNRIAEMP